MTHEEAFTQAAIERLEQHKLAGLGQFFSNMGGLKGLWNARNVAGGTGAMANMGNHVAGAWNKLPDDAKKRIYGAGAGMLGGGLMGYLGSDEGDHGMATAMGAAAGLGLGHGYQKALPHLQNIWGNTP